VTNQPKVSVIVPVYNVDRYLPQCLDSVVAQTLNDIEIICINDGSKDASLSILKEYADKDSRFKIIDKKNAGVSAARNDGIATATGKYIAFLDGDDFWESYCLEKACAAAEKEKADVVVFKHNIFDGERKVVWDDPNFGRTDEEGLQYAFSAVIWNKLYLTAFIRENQITFPTGIKIAEDTIFSLTCYFCHPVCCFVAEHFYNYRINRKDSATADYSCINGEVTAFNYLEQTDVFQKQPEDVQLKIAGKFLSGIEGHINRFFLHDDKTYMAVRDEFMRHLQNKYGRKKIEELSHLKKTKLLQRIFSIKNSFDKKYKIITVLGIKVRIRRVSKA